MIEIKNLSLKIGKTDILKNINLTVNDGETVGIIGPSGSGKSFLFRVLTMLCKPTSGSIVLDGKEITDSKKDIADARKKIGIVFQNFNLFDRLTVVENVMAGLVDLRKKRKSDAYSIAMKHLKSVGLADKSHLYPCELSGGQQQRLAIARTLALDPEIILLDEPTSSLDPIMRGEVESVIRMLATEGRTMMIITHEMGLAKSVCSKIAFLNGGSITEEGSPEKIFDNPENTETKRFVRALRVLELDVASKNFDFIGVQTTLLEYAYKNGISKSITEKMQSVSEELFNMVIIGPKEQNKMHIVFEYDKNTSSLNGEILFSGPQVDGENPIYFLSWPIIEMRTSSLDVEYIEKDGYTNKLKIKITD